MLKSASKTSLPTICATSSGSADRAFASEACRYLSGLDQIAPPLVRGYSDIVPEVSGLPDLAVKCQREDRLRASIEGHRKTKEPLAIVFYGGVFDASEGDAPAAEPFTH